MIVTKLESMKKRVSLFALCCAWALAALGQDAPVTVAGDIQLTGLLGSKLKIELLLEVNHDAPFFSNAGPDCLDLEGIYYYRTQLRPIRVKGRLCPANGTFFLETGAELPLQERFEGKWNVAERRLSGTWTQKGASKTLPFDLVAVEKKHSPEAITTFYRLVRTHMQGGDGDAEGAGIDDAQWTAGKGTITGFAPNWSGDIRFFSPVRLEYTTGYNSTARSSDYRHIYQLLPSSVGIFVLHSYETYHYDKTIEDPAELEDGGAADCGYAYAVYQVVEDELEDVTHQVWPAKMASASETDNAEREDAPCNGDVLSDGIFLPDAQKIWWNGSRFVTR